jgi:predicted amidohydrolase YtcJ
MAAFLPNLPGSPNARWQLLVHSNGDRSTDQVLAAYDAVLGHVADPTPGLIHRIEHFTVTTPAQVATAKRLGLGVSNTMGHVHYWGDWFKTRCLGEERARRIDPVREEIDQGLVYSFHSDSPVTDVDPLLWVKTAVTREMYDGKGVLGEEQRVGLEEALRGVTTNAAKHVMMDIEDSRQPAIGQLTEGRSADLVILAEDPWEVYKRDPSKLSEIEVLETWLAGRRHDWSKSKASHR